jgi:hypothetical protein
MSGNSLNQVRPYPAKRPYNGKGHDLTGQRFSRLTALYIDARSGTHRAWVCSCDCGESVSVLTSELISESTKSCGCLKKDVEIQPRTHGLSKSPEYRVWINMKSRCFNPTHVSYPNYGGRGIDVCDQWRHSFETFLQDMGNRPSSRHSIERKDPNGHYHPSNCCWATSGEQARNKRTTVLVCWDDHVMSLKDAAKHFGISYRIVTERKNQRGWSISRCLTELPRPVGQAA